MIGSKMMRYQHPALALAVCAVVAGAAAAGTGMSAAPPLKGLIVYWDESPWPSIWAMRADGTRERRILRNRQNAKRPRLSSDRKWVAFDGAPPGKPPITDFDIQVARIDGTSRRTLTSSSDWDIDAQWSPDGTQLSFTRMPPGGEWLKSAIWVMRSDGTGQREIGLGQSARWSPDGKSLVAAAPTDASGGDLFIIDIHTGARRPLFSSPQGEQPAGWSRDGKMILFTRFNDQFGHHSDVFVVNADGTNLRMLAKGGAAACWSPDGARILYTTRRGKLAVMNADGSGKVVVSPRTVLEPDWR